MDGNKILGYGHGEERFGYLTSLAYLIFTKTWLYKGFENFVINDIVRSRAKLVLDVGTGPAAIPIALAKNKGIGIYAVDPSKAMVGIAKIRTKGFNNIKIEIGSSRYIPFDKKFDLIFSSLSFHHWSGKRDALVYLKKFLKRNGSIRLYEYNKQEMKALYRLVGSHSVSKEELVNAARQSSLRIKTRIKEEFICAVLY